MTDRPILFSAPMVRALLGGRKTQTRRALGQFDVFTDSDGRKAEVSCLQIEGEILPRVTIGRVVTLKKLKAAIGDRLWVKETWRPFSIDLAPWDIEVAYAADGERRIIKDGEFGDNDWTMPKAAERGNVSPLFMPRWASRLTLTVTDVRVERLQDISEADAIAEGIMQFRLADWAADGSYVGEGNRPILMSIDDPSCVYSAFPDDEAYCWWKTARDAYAELWGNINGPGAWEANPWVGVYSFTVIPKNIDEA